MLEHPSSQLGLYSQASARDDNKGRSDMNAISSHIHSRRTANGIPMIRGAVMAAIFASIILTALPSITFAKDNDGDNNGRHSLVQQPYGLKTKSPFAATFQTIDTLQ